MKIKTTKKLNLPELIKYVWENGIENKDFLSNEELPCGKRVRVHVNPRRVDEFVRGAGISVESENMVVTPEYTFTVEVEEELTEETEIHGATLVYYNKLRREVKTFRYAEATSPSLKQILRTHSDAVALAVFSGKQLIWSKDTGTPEEGALEVSE